MAGQLFSLQKSSLARVRFSSIPDPELQGIYYMGCWSKANACTFFWGTFRHFSPLDRREQGKVTEGVGELLPALKVDVLVEREQVHKLP